MFHIFVKCDQTKKLLLIFFYPVGIGSTSKSAAWKNNICQWIYQFTINMQLY